MIKNKIAQLSPRKLPPLSAITESSFRPRVDIKFQSTDLIYSSYESSVTILSVNIVY